MAGRASALPRFALVSDFSEVETKYQFPCIHNQQGFGCNQETGHGTLGLGVEILGDAAAEGRFEFFLDSSNSCVSLDFEQIPIE